MQRVMFDAYAILAWLEEEPGVEFVNDLLRRGEAGELWCGVCAINIGEVYYRTCRKHHAQRADGHLALLLRLRWEIVPVSNDLVWDAAAIKAQNAISYADAFFIASANLHAADLVTNDPEIKRLTTRPSILWPGAGDTPKE